MTFPPILNLQDIREIVRGETKSCIIEKRYELLEDVVCRLAEHQVDVVHRTTVASSINLKVSEAEKRIITVLQETVAILDARIKVLELLCSKAKNKKRKSKKKRRA